MPLPTNPADRLKAARAAAALLNLDPRQRARLMARRKLEKANKPKGKKE